MFTLSDVNGVQVPGSIGLAVAVMFCFKIVGANLMRLYLSFADKKSEEKNAGMEATGNV